MKKHTAQNQQQLYGRYMTRNTEELLHNFTEYIKKKDVIDPCAGDGDLLNWAKRHGAQQTSGYDIDSTKLFEVRDTLLHPISSASFILSNPPYLARNKAKGAFKAIYDKWHQNDLYKCFLAGLDTEEGIAILPSNFLSESNDSARSMFFNTFSIQYAEYWNTPVFPGASTGITVIYFIKSSEPIQKFPLLIRPKEKLVNIELRPDYAYLYGSEFFDSIANASSRGISKGTLLNLPNTKLVLSLLDKNKRPQGLSINEGDDILCSEKAFTTYQLRLDKNTITLANQKKLANEFNTILNYYRSKYEGLFLPNYMGADQKILPVSYCYRLINSIAEKRGYYDRVRFQFGFSEDDRQD